jgi:arylsulfatase A-like enzyme
MDPRPLLRDEKVIEENAELTTLTKRSTEEAVRFIADSRDKPFFLYVPYTMPHVPLAASEKFKGKSAAGLYGDVVEELDWSAGEILAALKKHGLDKNTLVVLTVSSTPL